MVKEREDGGENNASTKSKEARFFKSRRVSAERFKEALEKHGFWENEKTIRDVLGYDDDAIPSELQGVAMKYRDWDEKHPLSELISIAEIDEFLNDFLLLAQEAKRVLEGEQIGWQDELNALKSKGDSGGSEARDVLERIKSEKKALTRVIATVTSNKDDIVRATMSLNDKETTALAEHRVLKSDNLKSDKKGAISLKEGEEASPDVDVTHMINPYMVAKENSSAQKEMDDLARGGTTGFGSETNSNRGRTDSSQVENKKPTDLPGFDGAAVLADAFAEKGKARAADRSPWKSGRFMKGTKRREIQDALEPVEQKIRHFQEMIKDKVAYIGILEKNRNAVRESLRKGEEEPPQSVEDYHRALDELYILRAQLGDYRERRSLLLEEWDSWEERLSSARPRPEKKDSVDTTPPKESVNEKQSTSEAADPQRLREGLEDELKQIKGSIDLAHRELLKKKREVADLQKVLDASGRKGIDFGQINDEIHNLEESLKGLEGRHAKILEELRNFGNGDVSGNTKDATVLSKNAGQAGEAPGKNIPAWEEVLPDESDRIVRRIDAKRRTPDSGRTESKVIMDQAESDGGAVPDSLEAFDRAIDAADREVRRWRRKLDELPEIFQNISHRGDRPDAVEIHRNLRSAEDRLESLKRQKERFLSGEDTPVKENVSVFSEQKKVLAGRFQEKFGISWEELNALEGFSSLSIGRKYLLLENLDQITLGRIQEEAADVTEKDYRNAFWMKKIWKGFAKRHEVAKHEKIKAAEFAQGGMKLHGDVLRQLVVAVGTGPEADLNVETGELELRFFMPDKELSAEGRVLANVFNTAAAALAHIPYGWSFDEADKKQKAEYERAHGEYISARENLLRRLLMEQGDARDGSAIGDTLGQLNGVEAHIEMQRFFTHHPEAEELLLSIRSESAWRRVWLGTVREKGLYLGGGYLARSLAVGVAGLAAAPVTAGIVGGAGIIGGVRGWGRAKEQLKRQDTLTREKGVRGRKDVAKNFVSSSDQADKLERLLDQIATVRTIDRGGEITDYSTGDDRFLTLRSMLASRVDYVKRKHKEGLIMFGDTNSPEGDGNSVPARITNEYRLLQAVARAEAWALREPKTPRNSGSTKRVDRVAVAERRLEKLLGDQKSRIDDKRFNYKLESAFSAGVISAGFAGMGVAVRELQERGYFDTVAETASGTWKKLVGDTVGQHTSAPGSRIVGEVPPPIPGSGKSVEAARLALEVKPGSGSSIERELIDRYVETGVAKDRTEAGRLAHRAVLDWARAHASEEGVTERQLMKSLGKIRSAEITIDDKGAIADLEFEPLQLVKHAAAMHGRAEVLAGHSVPSIAEEETLSAKLTAVEEAATRVVKSAPSESMVIDTPQSVPVAGPESVVQEVSSQETTRRAVPLLKELFASRGDFDPNYRGYIKALQEADILTLVRGGGNAEYYLTRDQTRGLLEFQNQAISILGKDPSLQREFGMLSVRPGQGEPALKYIVRIIQMASKSSNKDVASLKVFLDVLKRR